MSERPEIVPFDQSDGLHCPEVLVGTDEIFSKPSHSVTFRHLERQTDCPISLILKELRVEGHSREGVRWRTELTRSGQGTRV
jgi:hypothetical protein